MIEFEINGQTHTASSGETVIAVADKLGIKIPRFCYHKHLSVAANCRMCLVDIEGMAKPQPACSTPVMAGMKINTQSEKATTAQKSVMELLLINHPLDCPICDQGGECELQDVAMGYGSGISHFSENKRVVAGSDIGVLIQTDMTRCIHCSRCVRFGTEIAGMTEMGMTGRGEHVRVEPYVASTIDSELSGNMIDVCPVGALTSKPFRYQVRSWQLSGRQSIARHDIVGSNLLTQCYKNKVKRVVAAENDAINQTWISDRDRFSYQGLTHEKRLLQPKIKVDGKWQVVDWQVALDFTAKGFSKMIKQHHIKQLAGLASGNATLEELYVFQKLLRQLGCVNIDHRLHMADLSQVFPCYASLDLPDLAKQTYTLLIGGHPRLEQPMLNHRLRQQVRSGGVVDVINVAAFDFNYPLGQVIITPPAELIAYLAGILKALLKLKKGDIEIDIDLSDVIVDKNQRRVAKKIFDQGDKATLILGSHINGHERAGVVFALAEQICAQSQAKIIVLNEQANAPAALLANVLPSKQGLNAFQMFDSDIAAYLLLDVYPHYDCLDANHAIAALTKANFVCALNSYDDDVVGQYADVMLPMASFFENSGSHINVFGIQQSFMASVKAPEQAKPAWKILKVLADLFALPGFDWSGEAEILTEINQQKTDPWVGKAVDFNHLTTPKEAGEAIEIIWQVAPYAKDALCRHAQALSQSQIGQLNTARMSEKTATQLQLTAADVYHGVPVLIDNTVADNTVFVQTYQAKTIATKVCDD